MSAVDEILSQVDLNQLAQQVGADPAEVEQAARTALPALLGGLDANAADPAGAASLTEALGQHDGSLIDGGVDLAQVDPAEGEKIAHHIFGDNQEQVLNQLGGVGGGASKGIVAKLIPILAPIVLSWLAKKVLGGAGRCRPNAIGGRRGWWPRRHPGSGPRWRHQGHPVRRGQHRIHHQRRARRPPRRRPPLTRPSVSGELGEDDLAGLAGIRLALHRLHHRTDDRAGGLHLAVADLLEHIGLRGERLVDRGDEGAVVRTTARPRASTTSRACPPPRSRPRAPDGPASR